MCLKYNQETCEKFFLHTCNSNVLTKCLSSLVLGFGHQDRLVQIKRIKQGEDFETAAK